MIAIHTSMADLPSSRVPPPPHTEAHALIFVESLSHRPTTLSDSHQPPHSHHRVPRRQRCHYTGCTSVVTPSLPMSSHPFLICTQSEFRSSGIANIPIPKLSMIASRRGLHCHHHHLSFGRFDLSLVRTVVHAIDNFIQTTDNVTIS